MRSSETKPRTSHNGDYVEINGVWRFLGDYVSHLSLKPSSIFATNFVPDTTRKRSDSQKLNEVHLRNKKKRADMSKKSRANLFNASHWLHHSADWKEIYCVEEKKSFYFKTNFITLTIPSMKGEILSREFVETLWPKDSVGNCKALTFCEWYKLSKNLVNYKQFQKCLNVFLTFFRRHAELGNYLWKIEPQANGQLHVHLSTDQFLHYRKVREVWNSILQREGLLDQYFAKFGNYNPNSTDIHSIKNGFDAAGYVAKYLSKNPNFATQYIGRIWGCSYGLAANKKCKVKLDENEFKEFGRSAISNRVTWKTVEVTDKNTGVNRKLGTLFLLKNEQWKKLTSAKVIDAYKAHTAYVKSMTKLMPKEYYQIDLFSERSRVIYNEPPDIPSEYNPVQQNIFVPSQLQLF